MGKRDIMKYFVDARQQLRSLITVEKMESQKLQEEADAQKARYKDAVTSKIAVSSWDHIPRNNIEDVTIRQA